MAVGTKKGTGTPDEPSAGDLVVSAIIAEARAITTAEMFKAFWRDKPAPSRLCGIESRPRPQWIAELRKELARLKCDPIERHHLAAPLDEFERRFEEFAGTYSKVARSIPKRPEGRPPLAASPIAAAMNLLVARRGMSVNGAAELVADKLLWLWDASVDEKSGAPQWCDDPEVFRRVVRPFRAIGIVRPDPTRFQSADHFLQPSVHL